MLREKTRGYEAMPNESKLKDETFSVGMFLDYKNMLRDYYVYGYKTPDDYPKPEQKKQDAKEQSKGNLTQKYIKYFFHMNNILADYFEWSKNPQKRMFATADSQSMAVNPFQKIYRYCTYTEADAAYFLHIIAALSSWISLNGGQDYDGIEAALRLEEIDVNYEKNKDRGAMSLMEAIKGNEPLTTAQMFCFFPNGKPRGGLFTGKHDVMDDHLSDLTRTGMVTMSQDRPGANHKWTLPDITWKSLVEAGQEADPSFEAHLMAAIDFYSREYVLGEAGVMLLERADYGWKSPFRFKHEYFIQALNDFVLSDLLMAIEKEKWCRVSCSHGTSGIRTRMLCCPLKILVGTEQGKEFLFYYEPFTRSYACLRLDFINAVELFDASDVSVLLNTRKKEFAPDIKNAEDSMAYSWEIPASGNLEPNAVRPAWLYTVNFCIRYDTEKEYYIPKRLKRECRYGKVWTDEKNRSLLHFEIRAVDPAGLLPWIRSFYCRIVSCSWPDSLGFSFEEDVEKYYNIWNTDEFSKKNLSAQSVRYVGSIPPRFDMKLDEMKGSKRRQEECAHDQLFHEVFSLDFHMYADIFMEISSEKSLTDEKLDIIIKKYLKKYKRETLEENDDQSNRVKSTREGNKILSPVQVRNIFVNNSFLDPSEKKNKDYESRYVTEKGTDFYRDVLPLSVMELRWLKTIVTADDDKVGYFLSTEEQEKLKGILENIAPLPADKICYYDRYHFPENKSGKERTALREILKAISGQKILKLTYKPERAVGVEIKDKHYIPVIIEFSKRNNVFQAYMLCREDGIIYTMNLFRIENIEATDEMFTDNEKEEAERKMEEFRNKMNSVRISFYGIGDLADDILMEFSPWKKECVYDKREGIYCLTIYYHKFDESEIVIRLMKYGLDIKIPDIENDVYKKIKDHLEKQMNLIEKSAVTIEVNIKEDPGLGKKIAEELKQFHLKKVNQKKNPDICRLQAALTLYEKEQLVSELERYPKEAVKIIEA